MGEMRQLSALIKPLEELSRGADDLGVLLEFAEDDETGESEAELAKTVKLLEPKLAAIELRAMMSGEEDGCGAYVTVQAGEGGTDSSDWAEMLLRMYLRWAEQND